MDTQPKCSLGKRCLVHGFQGKCSDLLVKRAFNLIVDGNFTEDEQRYFWAVTRGQK